MRHTFAAIGMIAFPVVVVAQSPTLSVAWAWAARSGPSVV
jgi:hypothetical protein